ncbi:MAG: hypothetical protein KBC81_02710 [Candidatus Pacebacteria bacterium]|nr:hypothetical protein [Candidatus Paceibacterota bacterium]
MREKDNTVEMNIALVIKEIAKAFTTDLPMDLRRRYTEDFERFLLILSGKMSTRATDEIIQLCSGIPSEMLECKYRQLNEHLSHALLTRLSEMAARPRDEELGPEIRYDELAPGSLFDVVAGKVRELYYLAKPFEAEGRFLRFADNSIHSLGLEGSSHKGLPVVFESHSIVRKVIRRSHG